MATVSKRKQPEREVKVLRERLKIAERVFDDHTLEILVKFLNKGTISSIEFPISHGKEAIVFRATTADGGFLAVKVFKYETTSFDTMYQYIAGDPRFARVRKARRPLVQEWSRKEFANLTVCSQAGIPVPTPVACKENVVIMEYIGTPEAPAPQLRMIRDGPWQEWYELVLDSMKQMLDVGIVHADLSEYNMLVHDGVPWIIDMGQAVSIKHPRAMEFLEVDLKNVVKFFGKKGATASVDAARKRVVGNKSF